ncbi:MAG TPA: hydrogenase maturation nickel metallochaperone HypA [Povalibacter sp.]
MHELSVCQAIVMQVERIALQHHAEVCSITVRIGPLSGVEASLVEQAYPLAVAGTSLSAARLVIDSLPVRVRCLSCHEETVAAPNRMVCAQCGDWHTELVSGDELLLASVELSRNTSTDVVVQ